MSLLSRRRQPQHQPLRIAAPPGVKLVLHVGCGMPDEQGLHERFRGPEWHELRLDVDPGVQPDIVATHHRHVARAGRVGRRGLLAPQHRARLRARGAGRDAGVLPRAEAGRRGAARHARPPERRQNDRVRAARGHALQIGLRADLGARHGLRAGNDVAGGREYMAHRTGFTRGTLARKLGAAGFVDIEVTRAVPFALWAREARRPPDVRRGCQNAPEVVAARSASATTTKQETVMTPISRRTIERTTTRCSSGGSSPTSAAES